MLWTIFVCYCVIAIFVVTGLNLLGLIAKCGDEPSAVEQMSMSQNCVALISVLAIGVIFGPVLLPFMISPMWAAWKECGKESDYWIGIKNQQVRLSLDPLHQGNIDPELAEHFEAHSVAPLALGYQHLDDVWLKPQKPYQSKARLFLHPDGIAFAEAGRTIDTYYCEILSYLDDGTVVSTAPMKTNPFFKKMSTPKHVYYVQCLPGAEIEELLAKYERCLRQISTEAGVGIRKITNADWKAHYHFHNDRFGQLKYELDGGDQIDYEVVFPTASKQAVIASHQSSLGSDENFACVGNDNAPGLALKLFSPPQK